MTTPSPRHSSKSSTWGSPPYIVEAGRKVLGTIDLDPASSARSNKIVRAELYFTKRDDGLKQPWRLRRRRPVSIWLNPPGGWHNGAVGDSEVKHWWRKVLKERRTGPYFGDLLFLAFSIDALQVSQVDCEYSLAHFPTVIFNRRVPYLNPLTNQPVGANTHASSITYVPVRLNRTRLFFEVFSQFGIGVGPINWKAMPE